MGGSHRGGGGDREGLGGSVADVDKRLLAGPCAEESEGEERRARRSAF
jgi:hypothetical protein